MVRMITRWMALLLSAALLAGCAQEAPSESSSSASESSSSAPESAALEEEKPEAEWEALEAPEAQQTKIRLAAMKGPTAMGLCKFLSDTDIPYDFTLAGTADEIVPLLTKGELDMAAVPCNLASVLYNNTKGQVKLAAVNTLGVLYIVETGDTIQSVEDLRGKTILATGKGTTPEYALRFILTKNGIDPDNDVTIEYKSESTEVAAQMESAENAVAMLPEPYVTTLKTKNDRVRTALNLTEEWDKVGEGSALVTGVLVMRSAFMEENGEAASAFLDAYRESIAYTAANPAEAAQLIGKYDIVPAPVAEKALPACNLAFLEGEEMKTKVSGYLQALFDQNPKSVGGQLPDDAFYYQR